MKNGLVVGLTGGIATGKTTISEVFRNRGAYVINADSVGHQVLEDDPLVKGKLLSIFGKQILDINGRIDRSKLAKIVFNNASALHQLNKIIHPVITERIQEDIDRERSRTHCKIIVLEAPLLIEANLMHMVDVIVLVFADEDVQIERLLQRNLSLEEAKKRIRTQLSSAEKARFADYIIYNNGLLSDAISQAEDVWSRLMERACSQGK